MDSISQLVKQFKRGLTPEKVESKDGSKNLAALSRAARLTMSIATGFGGIAPVRKYILQTLEQDLKNKVKKKPDATVDDLVKTAVNTPEFMLLLKDVDLDESHLRSIAKGVIDNEQEKGS